MKICLNPNENLMKEGNANLFRNIEAVGGKLFLTNQRLFFNSHAFNVQSGPLDIPILDIKHTELSWTKLFGIIPLLPNSITVTTIADVKHKFVVYGRNEWKRLIDNK